MKIRNPKYPFKQSGVWDKCHVCFEDFSLTPCIHCGSGFDDEYIEVPSELETLRQRVAELEEMYELSADVASTTLARNAELTAERDALKQQRDELLAALETIVKDDSHNPSLMVMIAEEAIASVKEKA